jgi:hypothetical protein
LPDTEEPSEGEDHGAGLAVFILPVLAIIVVLGFVLYTIYGR